MNRQQRQLSSDDPLCFDQNQVISKHQSFLKTQQLNQVRLFSCRTMRYGLKR